MSKVDEFQVPALDRALTIMELLANETGGLRMREIAEMLEIPPNSVFRITGAMEARGYLERDEDMRYRLTRKLLSLGYAAIGENKLVEHALDVMRGLRDATGETVLVGVRIDAHGVVLEQCAASHPIKFLVDPGMQFPLHTSAPGKIFLAYMSDAEREAILSQMTLERFNDRTIVTREALDAELAEVLRNGFALDCGEQVEGLRCVGAPIFNHRGDVISAIWVTGPSFRFVEEALPIIGRQVVTAATIISGRFGFKLLPDNNGRERRDSHTAH